MSRSAKPASTAGPTIGAELDTAIAVLTRAGIPHADLMALSTWSVLANDRPGAVWLRRAEGLPDGDLVPQFRRAIAQQEAGEPPQYALAQAAFRFLELFVDHRVLIPRGDTEGLVDHVLEFGRRNGWGVVADIGTGGGAIALSLATEGSFERVIATDLSPDALDVARLNLARVSPATAVEFRQGSFLEPLGDLTVNVIVSNPPYVSSAEMGRLPAMVRDFEPQLALHGGPDGLTPATALLRGAARHLTRGGLLALEIDSSRGARTLDLARACGWRDGRVLPDATGRDRYFLATREPE